MLHVLAVPPVFLVIPYCGQERSSSQGVVQLRYHPCIWLKFLTSQAYRTQGYFIIARPVYSTETHPKPPILNSLPPPKYIVVTIAAQSYFDFGNFEVSLRREKKCSALTCLDLAIAPSSIATTSAFPTLSVTSETSTAQVTDTSSREVYLFKESSAVLSTTTDSGEINTIKDSHNEFIKSHVNSKNYEHISDNASSPES